MNIGKIVKSDSHINYVCQIHGPLDFDQQPGPADYSFGRFVRIAIRTEHAEDSDESPQPTPGKRSESQKYAVGVIYDTILVNPAFGSLGPRLSNETQVEVFSPDYISEKAVIIYVMVLGMIEQRPVPGGEHEILSVMHGVPVLSLELGSVVETMTDNEVCVFHYFSDPTATTKGTYLHMGYLPQIIAGRNSLLPMVTLQIIDQLERLFPQNLSLLSIVKRNFAWRLKVETTG